MSTKKLKELENRIKALENLNVKNISTAKSTRPKLDQLTIDLDELLVAHNKRFKKGIVFSGIAIPSENENRLIRWSCSGGFKSDKEFNEFIDQADANDISKFCQCFSSEEKLLIIRAIIKDGVMSQKQILEYTGLSQGQFYHHIKELILNRLIVKEKSTYDLSPMGHVLSVSFTGIINAFIK
ncbi:MAG: winged helix-turn-helix transcriptional regulator [Bacteriovoracaceae bacterium]|nr:winged helix-turn-helix transcriptional regulator [Bacteriovoracaceae bacterium]